METLTHGFEAEVRDSDIPIDCIAIAQPNRYNMMESHICGMNFKLG
ncbi:MAG: hypothetical protein F6K54_25990 [Okeania sp. SIO3B5]|nr:hypothetical protein [Okeania sp. SIO3B5]NEO56227.1 hypothetical protein [Okeania sp. SIO3B5]